MYGNSAFNLPFGCIHGWILIATFSVPQPARLAIMLSKNCQNENFLNTYVPTNYVDMNPVNTREIKEVPRNILIDSYCTQPFLKWQPNWRLLAF